jgi:hypothetical protein
VTGTLADVQAEPLYVPKFMLLPIQPVKTLREWFGGGNSRTNDPAPPKKTVPEPESR